jgi:L-glutamine:2-deoxy-scyllo-inosose/3-amino-2,3-dideoxy-scyllo-inosose aminotransferase
MPDMTRVQAFCKKHKLFLIEDCAHQHGSFWKGQGVGTFGDAASFSFQESKVLSSGEGGFNTCKTKETFERLYSLRNCSRGFMGDHTNALQSGNYRLTEWQAAILTCGLGRLDKQVKLRDANAIYLNSLLAQIPGVLPMRRRKEVTQQSYFNFSWRLDLSKFKKGVTNGLVCKALNAELHNPGYADFDPPYEPLNNCSLYRPQTKVRYKIDAAHWKAVNPKRFKLPVCKEAREKIGVTIHHSALMGTKKDMEDIAKAMAKIAENSSELV